MLQREECEVDHLDKRPNHPVGAQSWPVGLIQAFLDAGTLHGGHAAEEDTNHDGGEEKLVAGDAGECLKSLVSHVDVASKDSKPSRGSRAKDDWKRVSYWLEVIHRCVVKNSHPP